MVAVQGAEKIRKKKKRTRKHCECKTVSLFWFACVFSYVYSRIGDGLMVTIKEQHQKRQKKEEKEKAEQAEKRPIKE